MLLRIFENRFSKPFLEILSQYEFRIDFAPKFVSILHFVESSLIDHDYDFYLEFGEINFN